MASNLLSSNLLHLLDTLHAEFGVVQPTDAQQTDWVGSWRSLRMKSTVQAPVRLWRRSRRA